MMSENLLKNRAGLAPLIGTALMLAIVFLIVALIASAFFAGNNPDNLDPAPLADLRVYEYNTSTLKIEHRGGDPIDFSNSTTSVILDMAGKNNLLEASNLEVLKVGDTKLLPLKDRKGNLIPINAGDFATFKVIDLRTKKPVFIQNIRFMNGIDTEYQPGNDTEYQPGNDTEYQPGNDTEYQPGNDTKYKPGIVGYYYQGTHFNGPAVKHTDSRLKFAENTYLAASIHGSDIQNWPYGILNTLDTFSVVYEGFIKIEQNSSYTFYLTSDDWAQLYIDGTTVIKEPSSSARHPITTKTGTIYLPAGYHKIRVEMREYQGTSILFLEWSSESFSKCFVDSLYHTASPN
ncbi:PA14 domain-containing protein [Methanosarcina sp. 2.H.T.1A.6]|uniref:PA14 domain-containing protein n=1 Tax=Methanosarcina sp. 2.H.T.1A.6 TaxID=1483599 RepID=UPI0009E3B575|nr:PA14 domain-containing protein [Methanosarcina sp. 2.H.T.1A.6]